MMKKNSFEAFWKNWDNRMHGVLGYKTLKKEFFSLCERQAKKADGQGRQNDAHTGSMYEYGQMNAFRLVQGGDGNHLKVELSAPPTKKKGD